MSEPLGLMVLASVQAARAASSSTTQLCVMLLEIVLTGRTLHRFILFGRKAIFIFRFFEKADGLDTANFSEMFRVYKEKSHFQKKNVYIKDAYVSNADRCASVRFSADASV